jgi:hypothetical protein
LFFAKQTFKAMAARTALKQHLSQFKAVISTQFSTTTRFSKFENLIKSDVRAICEAQQYCPTDLMAATVARERLEWMSQANTKVRLTSSCAFDEYTHPPETLASTVAKAQTRDYPPQKRDTARGSREMSQECLTDVSIASCARKRLEWMAYANTRALQTTRGMHTDAQTNNTTNCRVEASGELQQNHTD